MPTPDSTETLPAGLLRPDYAGGGIVNLMASVISGRGGKSHFPPARALADVPVSDYRNVLLIMIDGLGYRYLQRRPDSTMAQHLKGRLTSVFPTTTAAAVTTFLTGLAPAQHALTGWHVWLEEIRTLAAVLPFRSRTGRESLESRGYDAARLLEAKPLYPGLEAESHVISPARIAHSAFNTAFSRGAAIHGYNGQDAFYDTILGVINGSQSKKYVYAYWSDLDHLGHVAGIGSKTADQHFEAVDAGFAELLPRLADSNTLVLLTADHGIVDTEAGDRVSLDDHAALTAMLDIPLCGEPRAAYCYIHRGESRAFETYVGAELEASAYAVASSALIEAGLFGPGTPHPRLAHRVGDYTLLMRDNYIITDTLPGEAHNTMIGAHGGLSAEELYVPLVVVEP